MRVKFRYFHTVKYFWKKTEAILITVAYREQVKTPKDHDMTSILSCCSRHVYSATLHQQSKYRTMWRLRNFTLKHFDKKVRVNFSLVKPSVT